MKKEVRARQFMYVQQLEHLKVELADFQKILNESNCSEWAYIIHDKDVNDKGEPVKKHIHCIMKFTHPQTIKHVAKIFNDKDNTIDIWKGRINNAYSYLIHRTTDAQDKFQYSPNDVIASFDFSKRIKEIEAIAKGARELSEKAVKGYLSQFSRDEITLDQLRTEIGVMNYARNENLITKIVDVKLVDKHYSWLKEFEGKRMKTYWLWGEAGAGKTTLAKYICSGHETAVLGSSHDFFQDYHGENYAILDDLRPNDFKYSDLLRMTDPYNHDKHAPRRYRDVLLNLECLIITTPYEPQEFYDDVNYINSEVDKFQQLSRRIISQEVTPKFMADIGLIKANENAKQLSPEEVCQIVENNSNQVDAKIGKIINVTRIDKETSNDKEKRA